jgi:hypothetical protein
MKGTVFIYTLAGMGDSEVKKTEAKVEVEVKKIIDKLKQSHSKFEDKDFGPSPDDEFGGTAVIAQMSFCQVF